jgi:hypothetical protein
MGRSAKHPRGDLLAENPQPPSCVDLQAGVHRLLDALVLKGYGWKASEEIL